MRRRNNIFIWFSECIEFHLRLKNPDPDRCWLKMAGVGRRQKIESVRHLYGANKANRITLLVIIDRSIIDLFRPKAEDALMFYVSLCNGIVQLFCCR